MGDVPPSAAACASSAAAGPRAGKGTRIDVREVRAHGRLRAALTLLGPAFVAAVAYVDPGNFATNFAAGTRHGYQLVWVIVLADVMAILVQYLSSKAGLATGRNLPELCRERFGSRANIVLWVQAELVAMATDLAEFVGAAIGLHLLFDLPLFPAGIVTAVVAFAILALQRRGRRRFEVAIVALLVFVAAGIVYLFAITDQNGAAVARGLLPHLGGSAALTLSVAIIGATVMPHVVYLHSALQTDRVATARTADRRTALTYNKWDCIVGLGLAGLVNVAILCVGAGLSHASGPHAGSGDLVTIHSNLGRMVGGGAALAFGVALLASGLSSSSVGTYSGQVVMAGFMNWRIPLLARRLLTMLPALIVLALVQDTTSVLVYSQIALSFGIPFALIPLLLVTRDRTRMGSMVNRHVTTILMALTSAVVISLNVTLLATAL